MSDLKATWNAPLGDNNAPARLLGPRAKAGVFAGAVGLAGLAWVDNAGIIDPERACAQDGRTGHVIREADKTATLTLTEGEIIVLQENGKFSELDKKRIQFCKGQYDPSEDSPTL